MRSILTLLLVFAAVLPLAGQVGIGIIIDHSGSMGSNDPNAVRLEAARLLVDLMESGKDGGAVIGFGTATTVQQSWTTALASMKQAIQKQSAGGTNYNPALNAAKLELDKAGMSTRAIVFFSDGEPQDDYSTSVAAIKAAGYKIYAIGFGDAGVGTMQNLASETGGRAYSLNVNNLQTTMLDVISRIRGVSPPSLTDTTLNQGESKQADFTLSCSKKYDWVKFTAIWDVGSTVALEARSPSGSTYSAEVSSSYGVITVNNPQCGTWRVTLTGTHAASGVIELSYGVTSATAATGEITASTSPRGGSVRLGTSGTWYSEPHTFRNMSPGNYTVYGSRTGYNTSSRTVSVTAGAIISTTVPLSQQTGSIEVTASPAGTEVRVDSGSWRSTPATFSGVAIGNRNVEARKGGYYGQTRTVGVSSGQTTTVDFTLVPVGVIDVTLPGMGISIQPGQSQAVQWAASNISGNVRVDLYAGDQRVETLADSVSVGGGQYAWQLPVTQATGESMVVRVTSLSNSAVYGQSEPFDIVLSELRIGQIVITADKIISSGSGQYRASGNVRLNDLIHYSATLDADADALRLSGVGRFFMPATGQRPEIPLFEGRVNLQVDSLRLQWMALSDPAAQKLALSQFPVAIESIELRQRGGEWGLEIGGMLKLGVVEADIGTDGHYLRIDRQGVSLDGLLRLPRFKFGTWGFRDTELELKYRDPNNNFITTWMGKTTLELPAKFDVEARLGFYDGLINLIGVGIDFKDPGLNIINVAGAPLVFLQRIYGEVDELATPEPWVLRLGEINRDGELTSGVTLTLGPQIQGYYALKGGLAMQIDGSGRFWGAGELFVMKDDYRIARGDLIIDPGDLIYVSAELEWQLGDERLGALTFARGAMALDRSNTLRAEMLGGMTGQFAYIFKLTISGGVFMKIRPPVNDGLPDAYMVVYSELGPFALAATYDFIDEELEFPSNTDLVEQVNYRTMAFPMSMPNDGSGGVVVHATTIQRAGGYVFALQTAQDTAGLQLLRPDGQRMDVGTPAVGYLYEAGEGAIVGVEIDSNSLGQWQLIAPAGFNQSDVYAEVHRVRDLPQVDNVRLKDLGNGLFEIQWEDYNPQGGELSVLYSRDGGVAGSGTIVRRGSAHSSDQVVWNSAEVPAGDYAILVQLTMPGQPPVVAAADDLARIQSPDAPAQVRNLRAASVDGALALSWDGQAGSAGYSLELRQPERPGAPVHRLSTEAGQTSHVFPDVQPGVFHEARVRAFNDDLVSGAWSNWVGHRVQAAQGANQPPVVFAPAGTARVGQAFAETIAHFDPEGKAVTFTLLAAPQGMQLSPEGTFSWTPQPAQVGWRDVRVRAQDADGIAVERDFTIFVHAAGTSSAQVDEPLFIEVADRVVAETWADTLRQQIRFGSRVGTTAALSAEDLPAGARLEQSGYGVATLVWYPGIANVGEHGPVLLTVSDGSQSARKELMIEVKDIVARITNPSPESRQSGVIDVVGTVGSASGFAGAVLEFGSQYGTMQVLKFLVQPVTDGVLHGGLDTRQYPDGLYRFRLRTEDYAGNALMRETFFFIDNSAPGLAGPMPLFNSFGEPTLALPGGAVFVDIPATEPADVVEWRWVAVSSGTVLQASGDASGFSRAGSFLTGQLAAPDSGGQPFRLEVRLRDLAGNTSGWLASERLFADGHLELIVTDPSEGANIGASGQVYTVRGIVLDPFALVESVEWRGNNQSSWTGAQLGLRSAFGLPWSFPVSTFLNNQLEVRYRDRFGRLSMAQPLGFTAFAGFPVANLTAPHGYWPDLTVPWLDMPVSALPVDGDVAPAQGAGSLTWKLELKDGSGWRELAANQTSRPSGTRIWEAFLADIPPGDHALRLSVDSAGNTIQTERAFTRLERRLDRDGDGLADAFEERMLAHLPAPSLHIFDIHPWAVQSSTGLPNATLQGFGWDPAGLIPIDWQLAGLEWSSIYTARLSGTDTTVPMANFPWIYHPEAGWMLLAAGSDGGIHFFDPYLQLIGWTKWDISPLAQYFGTGGSRWAIPEQNQVRDLHNDTLLDLDEFTGFLNTPKGFVMVLGGTLEVDDTYHVVPPGVTEITVDTFYIGKTEVTWAEWQLVQAWAASNGYDIGSSGVGCADDYPVHSVNWFDVLKWCNAKSEMEGLTPVYKVRGEFFRTGEESNHHIFSRDLSANGYRLPDEVEWEFAARGGNQAKGYTYSGSDNLNAVGWYWNNSRGTACSLISGRGTWPVGQKAANELGLYDMSGNVQEWVWDRWDKLSFSDTRRVLRGGSWSNGYSNDCTVSARGIGNPFMREGDSGFRLARSTGQ